MLKNKKFWLWLVSVVALAALIGLMVFLWIDSRPQPETLDDGYKEITVTVVHKDGTEKEFTFETEAEYLDNALMAESLIAGEMSDYGLMIHTVDGEKADWNTDQGWWQIFIGEESATVGASYIVLEDGGDYSLVYTIG